jgi:hypothetical protein
MEKNALLQYGYGLTTPADAGFWRMSSGVTLPRRGGGPPALRSAPLVLFGNIASFCGRSFGRVNEQ